MDSPGPDTGTTSTARRSHYAAALVDLDLADDVLAPSGDAAAFHLLRANVHAQMLLANEARVANLIRYAAILLPRNGERPTPEAIARLDDLERRIDLALGTTVEETPRG